MVSSKRKIKSDAVVCVGQSEEKALVDFQSVSGVDGEEKGYQNEWNVK